jgi:hypothetical protein
LAGIYLDPPRTLNPTFPSVGRPSRFCDPIARHEFQSFICRWSAGSSGYPHRPSAPFPTRKKRSSPPTVHRLLSQAASSSPKRTPLQRLPSRVRSVPLTLGASFLGVRSPSSRCQPAASLRRASRARRLSVLDVSHVPDGLLRHCPCGFISPHYHVQGSPFRGFSSRTAATPRRHPVPSRRWR